MSYDRTDPAEPGCKADRLQRPLLTSRPLPAVADTWR
jgi:hypothetical protein